jgi:hypothetical protein
LKGNRNKNHKKGKMMDSGFWTRNKKLNTIKKCKDKLRNNWLDNFKIYETKGTRMGKRANKT